VQDGQGEGGGLAGAGLGDAQEVAPFGDRGDGFGLDGSGGFVTLVGNGTENALVERKFGEENGDVL